MYFFGFSYVVFWSGHHSSKKRKVVTTHLICAALVRLKWIGQICPWRLGHGNDEQMIGGRTLQESFWEMSCTCNLKNRVNVLSSKTLFMKIREEDIESYRRLILLLLKDYDLVSFLERDSPLATLPNEQGLMWKMQIRKLTKTNSLHKFRFSALISFWTSYFINQVTQIM